MARIRQIKPDLFRHETLFALEQHSSLPVRLAFIGLWTVVDRDGRFRWRPREIKLDVMPYDEIDFDAVLNALASKQFIVSYIVDGERYGYIPSWNKHQNPHVKEKGSTVPAPDSPGSSLVSAPDENSFSRAEYGIRNTVKTPLPPLQAAPDVNSSKPVLPATPLSKNSNGHKPDLWQNIWETCRKIVPVEAMGEFGLGDLDHWFRRGTQVSFEGGLLRVNTDHDTVTEHRGLGKYAQWIREARSKFGVTKIEFFLDGKVKEIRVKPRPI